MIIEYWCDGRPPETMELPDGKSQISITREVKRRLRLTAYRHTIRTTEPFKAILRHAGYYIYWRKIDASNG